jgi:hypothetical protein
MKAHDDKAVVGFGSFNGILYMAPTLYHSVDNVFCKDEISVSFWSRPVLDSQAGI